MGEERKLSLTEVVRRGLELLLDRYPSGPALKHSWTFPLFDGGAPLVPLEQLENFSYDDEPSHGLPGDEE